MKTLRKTCLRRKGLKMLMKKITLKKLRCKISIINSEASILNYRLLIIMLLKNILMGMNQKIQPILRI